MTNVRYLATYTNSSGLFKVCFTDDRMIFIIELLSYEMKSVKFWDGTDLKKIASRWNMTKSKDDDLQISMAWERLSKFLRYLKPLSRVKHSDVKHSNSQQN